MNKLAVIDDFILKSQIAIKTRDVVEAMKLHELIIGTYVSDIPHIKSRLTNYNYFIGGGQNEGPDYIADLENLVSKLQNYKCDLQREEEKEKRKMQFSQPIFNFNNTNTNTSSSNSNSVVEMNILYEQVIDNIFKIDDNILSKLDKDKLEEMLFIN